jgi:hypothetical protein
MGIIFTGDRVVTICRYKHNLLRDLPHEHQTDLSTAKPARFVLHLLWSITNNYLIHLSEIKKIVEDIEDRLQRSLQNREVLQLLHYQKSLVYFTTALRANETMLERLQRGEFLKMERRDADLLDNVFTENRQAIVMIEIARDILSQMMDAFASIISNNLNVVMKFLAASFLNFIQVAWRPRCSGLPVITLCLPATLSLAGRSESELGAFRCAPSSTPTPNLSTNSPPSQPVTSASPAPTKDKTYTSVPGSAGALARSSQLTMKRPMTTTLPMPCHSPIALARVSEGIASQSINPKIAAASPPMIPAAIIQKAISDHPPTPVRIEITSKMTAVASKPSGNTMRIGCAACPNNFTLLSISFYLMPGLILLPCHAPQAAARRAAAVSR